MAVVAAPERAETLETPVRRTPKRSWKNHILSHLHEAHHRLPVGPDRGDDPVQPERQYRRERGCAKVSFRWQGFTLEWWKQWNGVPDLTSALWNSLFIAVVSTIVATVFGTMIALALVRYRFRGAGTLEIVMFLNIAAPEIVLGAALLSFFV